MNIYLDNNATTAVAPEVQLAMQQIGDQYGNASSVHLWGRAARRLVNEAREQVAEVFRAPESSLIFTSGATESLNAAMLGFFLTQREGHLIVSQVEHSAVLDTAKFLEGLGVEVTYLPVDEFGGLDPQLVRQALRPHTKMVAVMFANNEIGNLYPVKEIGDLARERGIYYLCDAVQAVGKLPIRLDLLSIDFLAASAHKFHGPKGIGLLYVSPRVKDWQPLLHGGRQERGHRAGTENVAGIVGFATALALASQTMDSEQRRIASLRDRLQQGLRELVPNLEISGDPDFRIANTLNVRFPDISGETLLMKLDMQGVAVSVGAACDSGSIEASHVLLAMGLSSEAALSGLRFSLSRYNTEAEIEEVLRIFSKVLDELK